MVREALESARNFIQLEKDTLEQLAPVGASYHVEAITDILVGLNSRRLVVVSVLLAAEREANEHERQEIQAAMVMVNSPGRAF